MMVGSTSKTFYSAIKPLTAIGSAFGIFPCSNILGENIKFRWLSLPVLFAVIFNGILFGLSLDCSHVYIRKLVKSSKRSLTDSLSIGGLTGLEIWTKYIVVFLCLYKTPKMATFIQQIGEYDMRFGYLSKLRIILNTKLLVVYMGGILGAVTGLMSLVKTNEDGGGDFQCLATLVFGTDVIGFLPLSIFELSMTVFIAITVIFTSAIKDRILSISQDFKKMKSQFSTGDRSEDAASDFLYKAVEATVQHQRPLTSATVNQMMNAKNIFVVSQDVSLLINRLGALIELKELMEQALSLIMFALVSSGILHLILFVYLALISIKDLVGAPMWEIIDQLLPLTTAGLITLSRLLLLSECGQQLENSVVELADEVKSCDVTTLTKSLSEKVQYLQHLAVQVRFELSAAGYYILNRVFVSSLVGPVITFVVVLAQFRISDVTPVAVPGPAQPMTSSAQAQALQPKT